MKKRVLAMFLATMMLLSLAGCGKKEEPAVPAAEPESIEEPAPESEPVPEPEPVGPAGTNPLTGLPMEPEYENDRPVAVMFNNLKAAQPQLSISQADIIYEVPAEGGITRMLGVFQSLEGVGTLGSIRSSRPYYLELALGHDALYVHAGGSPEAYKDIPAWGVDNMDGVNGGSDAKIFWRDAERRKTMDYEHTLVTSGEKIQEYVDGHFRTEHKDGYTYTQAFSEDGTPAGGAQAKRVTLKFSNYKIGIFDYDAASGKYLVSQYGICDYLYENTVEEAESYAAGKPWTRVIWDVTAVAWLTDTEGKFMQDRLIPSPIPQYDLNYSEDFSRHLIRYVYNINRDELFEDLFKRLCE